jgi:hypothetical protein
MHGRSSLRVDICFIILIQKGYRPFSKRCAYMSRSFKCLSVLGLKGNKNCIITIGTNVPVSIDHGELLVIPKGKRIQGHHNDEANNRCNDKTCNGTSFPLMHLIKLGVYTCDKLLHQSGLFKVLFVVVVSSFNVIVFLQGLFLIIDVLYNLLCFIKVLFYLVCFKGLLLYLRLVPLPLLQQSHRWFWRRGRSGIVYACCKV